jgi:hypothetical protein
MRKHSSLAGRKAINWADTVAIQAEEIATADEVEAALEVGLETSGGVGATRIKRADTPKFQYGSVGPLGEISGASEEFEFGSAGGGSGLRGPSIYQPSSGRTLGDGAGGFNKGETPALNTALARHGKMAVKRVVGNGGR